MAFDMYTQGRKDCIDHDEECLFVLINDDWETFPQLNELWSAFYDGPRINPQMADDLVHELLVLDGLIQEESDGQWLTPVIRRLVNFFSYAHQHAVDIRCVSD